MSEPTPGDPALCDPEVLVALVRAGRRDALERMTRCYGARLIAVGRRQCGDADKARDAVQDALVSAAEHLTDFRGDGSLEGWLSTMVTRACRRMQRGRKNDPALHTELTPQTDGSVFPPPDQLAAQARLAAALDAALLTLPAGDRAMVLLADVNGWRAPEIAEAMQMTPGQVRTRLSRARARLRDELAPLWREWSIDSEDLAIE